MSKSKTEKPFLVITGMHRSGTSFLARALNLRGTYLGDLNAIASNEWTPSEDNLRGHWEYKKFVELTDKTLSQNNGSWDNVPDKINVDSEIGKEIKNLSKELLEKKSLASGFKDPRVLLCLESWSKFLPENLVIVGIFRHPLKVAESLKKRNNFSYEKSLKLWSIYNKKLLSILEENVGFLINFDWPKEKLLSEIDVISSKLGLVKNIDLSSWYTEELFHSDKTFQSSYDLSSEVESIYSKLIQRSQQNQQINIEVSYNKENHLDIIEGLLQNIQSQGENFKKFNDKNLKAIIKLEKENAEKSKAIIKLEKENAEKSKLEKENAEKSTQISELQNHVQLTQNQIKAIHQSFVFRLLRKYDNSVGKIIPLRPKKYLKDAKEELSQDEKSNYVNQALTNLTLKKKDVICFPIINWDYRIQRSQHLLRKFSQNGHRVFYLKTNLRNLSEPYQIKLLEDNIYEIELNSPKFFDIYKDKFNKNLVDELISSFQKLSHDLKLDPFCFVEFPTWIDLVLELRTLFNYKVIFDCLDDFGSFPGVNSHRNEEENSLFQQSDLVTTSSHLLQNKASKFTKKTVLVPNAGEFSHFNRTFDENILKQFQKPIVGYFGSIAEWFDKDLIEFIAQKRPNFTFVLIGHTFGANIDKLEKLSNVHFLGEQPYSQLPRYLQEFNACLIPFKINQLIEATHPIKIYEYFAAGKPVISTNFREISHFKDLCYIAKNKDDFLTKLDLAINEKDPNLNKKRIEFSSKNTWEDRFQTIYSHLNKLPSFELLQHRYSSSTIKSKI